MASEAQVVGDRWNAEGPPRRHRDHRDDPYLPGDTVLMSFSVPSVSLWCRIHKPRKATRVRPNCAKQSQSAGARMNGKCRMEKGLRWECGGCPCEKTKPICPSGGLMGIPDPTRAAAEHFAKQSQLAGVGWRTQWGRSEEKHCIKTLEWA